MSTKLTHDAGSQAQSTLTEDQIQTDREVGRRSVLTAIGATVLGATATALGGCSGSVQAEPVAAQPVQQSAGGSTVVVGTTVPTQTGITDSDGGPYADPANNGRGGYGHSNYHSGMTDSDGGENADPAGNGRGSPRGYNTGITDADQGRITDPGGQGRGLWNRAGWTSNLTDSDQGQWADPAGNGRGHR